MKRFFLTCMAAWLSFSTIAAEKHALIIAIGDYPSRTGWGKISSKNDVPLITEALLGQGFADENIITLIDAQATKNGIIQAFEHLNGQLKKGDIVVVHYSGHGQQIFDDNGDEADGLDEALVPYDAFATYSHMYQGENHIRDDQLEQIINQYRNLVGSEGQVLFIMDSCHSGSMTRGGVARGGVGALVPSDWIDNKQEEKSASGLFQATEKLAEDAAPFVMISGASASELNYEYQGKGSLSYAFAQAMARLEGGFTYRQLFANILSQMQVIAPRQNPVIEGDIGYELFGGNYVPQQNYFTVKKIVSPNVMTVPAGSLQGLFEGTTLLLMPSGSTAADPAKALGKGEVRSSKYNESTIVLESALENVQETDIWLFVDQLTYGDMYVKLFLDPSVTRQDIRDGVRDYLEKNNLGEVVAEQHESDATMYFENGSHHLAVTNDLLPVEETTATRGKPEVDELNHKIFRFAQGQYLKGLQMNNTAYAFSFRLIPANQDPEEGNSEDDGEDDGQPLKVVPGQDEMWLEVTNNGTMPIYVSIVEINSQGQIASFFPHEYCPLNDQERMIPPGRTQVFRNCLYEFGDPYEKLMLKGFASATPLNFQQTVDTDGAATRGNANPLENFLQQSYQPTRGSAARRSSGGADGYSAEFIYEIVRAK